MFFNPLAPRHLMPTNRRKRRFAVRFPAPAGSPANKIFEMFLNLVSTHSLVVLSLVVWISFAQSTYGPSPNSLSIRISVGPTQQSARLSDQTQTTSGPTQYSAQASDTLIQSTLAPTAKTAEGCIGHDNCLTLLNTSNKCITNEDKSYTCVCEGAGFTACLFGQSCEFSAPPPCDPCSMDPCSSKTSFPDSLNVCVNTNPCGYQCICKAPWRPSLVRKLHPIRQ